MLDRESFGRLYEETFDAVFRYACVLTDDEEHAENLTVDVYRQAWRQRPLLNRVAAPLTWLLSRAHAGASRAGPGKRQRPTGAMDLEARAAARLHQAVRELPPEEQHVILLRLIQRRPITDVADQLGESTSTIQATQYGALSHLRDELDPVDLRNALSNDPWDRESPRARRARMGRLARTRGIIPPLRST